MKELHEILDITKKLIRFKTTSDNPNELERCIDFIEGYFSDCDVIVRRYDKNNKPSLVVLSKRTKKPEMFLVGHIDVVPAVDRLFQPKIRGKYLYARGAYDDKSSVALMMVLMKGYSRHHQKPDFGLMITSDEETSGKDGAGFLLEKYSSNFALVLDGGTDYNIITKEKGALHLTLSATGQNAHGSTPWEGENAIDKILDFYHKLKKRFPPSPKSERKWVNTLSIGMIKGGHAPNQVPDHAEISIDMRFTNDADKEKILDLISKSQGIGLKILTDAKFLNTENNLQYVMKLKQSANRILGRPAKLDREEGASDARHFADKGIPSVLLWPIGHHAHSENEYVDIKSLVKLYNILKNFIDTGIPHY